MIENILWIMAGPVLIIITMGWYLYTTRHIPFTGKENTIPSSYCIKAKYIGKNGSLGYFTNQQYDIGITIHSGMLWVMCNGHIACPYSSVKTFAENWTESK